MKKIIVLLPAITIFMLCASVGYQLATRTVAFLDLKPGDNPLQSSVSAQNQKCLLSIQVDRLDVQRPRLISAWVTFLYFEQEPYKVDFIPVYFPTMNSEKAMSLEKAFELDNHGAPASEFWRAFAAFDISCKDYILIDEYGMVKVLNWINGREDMADTLQRAAGNQEVISILLEQSCDQVTGSADREMAPFHWSDLAPGHIHTNLLMETALLYWERLTHAPSPGTCTVDKNP